MTILIDRTFELYLPHDPEDDICEADDSGLVSECEPCTFRELIEILRGGECSSSPSTGTIYDWVTHSGSQDVRHGGYEDRSVHYSRKNPKRNEKYWRLAFKVCGYTRD